MNRVDVCHSHQAAPGLNLIAPKNFQLNFKLSALKNKCVASSNRPPKNPKQVTKKAIITFLLYHRVSGPEFGEPRSLE